MPVSSPPVDKRRTREIPEENVYLEILKTSETLSYRVEKLLKSYDLTGQQYNVLRILYVRRGEEEGVPFDTIRENLVTSVPDVSRLIDRMYKTGWVERTRCPDDRRCMLVKLTPKGKKRSMEAAKALAELHEDLLGHMEPDKLDTLIQLLGTAREPHDHPG